MVNTKAKRQTGKPCNACRGFHPPVKDFAGMVKTECHELRLLPVARAKKFSGPFVVLHHDSWHLMLQTVAAVASSFHENGLYQELYDKKGTDYGGFPGLWQEAGDMGEALFRAEQESGLEAGEDYDWIDTVDAYVRAIYEALMADKAPDYKALALTIIRQKEAEWKTPPGGDSAPT